MIQNGQIDEVFEFLQSKYPILIEEQHLVLSLYAQQFLEFIRNGEINKAIELAQKHFPSHEDETLCFIDNNGKLQELKLEVRNIKC